MNVRRGPLPTLRELQRWLADGIVAPRRRDDAANPTNALEALVDVPAHASAAERLHVYAGGYPARILEALAETFPAVAHMVGEGAFAALAQRYAATVPLRSYNLNDAGAGLAEYLARDRLAEGLPFLPDLARLEWLVVRAFHAPDEPPADPTRFTGWTLDDWERAVMRFQPSVYVVRSAWPIREIWAQRDTPIAEIDVDLNDRPDRVLVRRRGFGVLCESLDAAEADALEALLAGEALGAVMADLAAAGGDPTAVSAWFARWMALGLLT